jgi:small subunit ribosomal protein S2
VGTTLEEMVQLGLHFGHQARKWNPKMAPYIYGKRNGIHVIDIVQTASQLREVSKFLTQAASEGKTFLFVGTKKQVSSLIAEAAQECDAFYLNQRWLGGMLTNWQTIKTSIARLVELRVLEKHGRFDTLPKKEASSYRKQKERLEKYLGGVADMRKIPDVVIIVGQPDEKNAVLECQKVGLRTVTILDTDCDPTLADLFIPANDDSARSVKFLLDNFVESIQKGKAIHTERTGTSK